MPLLNVALFLTLFLCNLCNNADCKKFRYTTTIMSGVSCRKTIMVSSAGILQFSHKEQGYLQTSPYCEITLRAEDSFKSISAIITHVDMLVGSRGVCNRDKLDIYSGTSSEDPGAVPLTDGICTLLIPHGKKSLGFISHGDQLVIKMTSFEGNPFGMGFRLVYNTVTKVGCESDEWMCCDKTGCINKQHRSDGEPNCIDQSDERTLPSCVSKVAAGVIAASVFLVVGIVAVVIVCMWQKRIQKRKKKQRQMIEDQISFTSEPRKLGAGSRAASKGSIHASRASLHASRASLCASHHSLHSVEPYKVQRIQPSSQRTPLLHEAGDDSVFEEEAPPPYSPERPLGPVADLEASTVSSTVGSSRPRPAPRARSLRSLNQTTNSEREAPRADESDAPSVTPRTSIIREPVNRSLNRPSNQQLDQSIGSSEPHNTSLRNNVHLPLVDVLPRGTSSPCDSNRELANTSTPPRATRQQETPQSSNRDLAAERFNTPPKESNRPTPLSTSTPRGTINRPDMDNTGSWGRGTPRSHTRSARPELTETTPKSKDKKNTVQERVQAVVDAKKQKPKGKLPPGPPEDRGKGPPEDSTRDRPTRRR